MRNVSVAVCIALAVWSCQDPECAPTEIKFGSTCRSRTVDSDAAGDMMTGEARSDAATAMDAMPPPVAPTPDAATGPMLTPVDDSDAGPMTAPTPFCGDGILNGTELCDPKIAAGQSGACLTAADCKNDKCSVATLSGAPEDCNVRCETSTVRECAKGDGCCPAGCNYENDDSCSASCGDGLIDTKETCEPDVGTGCSISCAPANSCEKAALVGEASNCNVDCVRTKIVSPNLSAGDGCCPEGANALNDKDCTPKCMNGVKEGAETCDGTDCPTVCNDSDPCTGSLPPNGSAASCNVTCPSSGYPVIKPANDDKLCCPGAGPLTDNDCGGCGNGKVEAGETCDKNCPSSCDDGNACTVDSQSGNSATCNLLCSHVPKGTDHSTKDGCCPPGATAATDLDCVGCGNGVKEGSEQCDDGNTTNGDLCDQRCMIENNPNTPGDDRSGMVICGSASCVAAVGCSMKATVDPVTKVVTSTIGCGLDPNATLAWTCDGPEECAAGQVCALPESRAITMKCVPPSNLGFACHTNADCGARAPCNGSSEQGLGVCAGAP